MLGFVVSDITNPFLTHIVSGTEDAALKRVYLSPALFSLPDHILHLELDSDEQVITLRLNPTV